MNTPTDTEVYLNMSKFYILYVHTVCKREFVSIYLDTTRRVASDLSQCLPSMCNICNAIPENKLLVR